MVPLCLAVVLFVVSHVVLATPRVRSPLVARLGEIGFRVVYSTVATALIVWCVMAYREAPVIDVWFPPTALRHVSLSLMPLACILLVAGLSTANPSAIGSDPRQAAAAGPVGITKITRHPVMWAFALWGLLHLLANGDAAGMVLFGGMTALALGGAAAQDHKKLRQLGAPWSGFAAQTSFLPFFALATKRTRVTLREIGYARLAGGFALYAGLLALHPWLFGVNPLAIG